MVKNPPANAGDIGSIPESGRSPGGQFTPVFSPGKFHGQRSLAGYSPWGHKESDMTEHTHIHTTVLAYLSNVYKCFLLNTNIV